MRTTCNLTFLSPGYQKGCAQFDKYYAKKGKDRMYVKIRLTLENGKFKTVCLRPFGKSRLQYQKVVGDLYLMSHLKAPYCSFGYKIKEDNGPWEKKWETCSDEDCKWEAS
ncbi:unnamed protein product, partial [Mesorhabditis spiculigera]